MSILPASTSELASALRRGSLPLDACLSQLEERFAAREGDLHAFVAEPDRFQRLRREAAGLEARFPDPELRPSLYGLTVGVKDIFHVAGLPTRAGSRLPPEVLDGEEAEAVSRLRAAGALVAGKTVTTEFAWFAPGPTRNPHHPDHTPGGSSSGSAAAVAAGLCPLALGTQTIGSIIRPAAFCGVVGFKPSYGRISAAGVIPLSPSLDQVGILAPDLEGVARAAAVLCHRWQRSQAGAEPILGVPEGPYLERASTEGLFHFREALHRLAASGLRVVTVAALRDFGEVEARHRRILAAEAYRVHQRWQSHHHLYDSRTRELLEEGAAVDKRRLAADRGRLPALRAELEGCMDEAGIDLWACPSAVGPAPPGLASTGDPVMNLPWTQAGLPSLGLPSGRSASRLPLGLQLVGRFGCDEELLEAGTVVAASLQQTSGGSPAVSSVRR